MDPIRPLVLLNNSNVKWTAAQEKAINRDYPFYLHLETPGQYVIRTYLQFLWLPESIMSLNLFVPSLARVQQLSLPLTDSPHPLHVLLDPILLSTRSSSKKYQIELRQIIANGIGAGEIEETMMWYAFNSEKVELGTEGSNNEDPAMAEEKWKDAWLQRLERREVQIQILLYFLKLSLPGVCPSLPPVEIPQTENATRPSKKGRHNKKQSRLIIPSPTERLESFMDKLSTWQLVDKACDTQKHVGPRPHDWMQAFYEDIVEPQFKSTLPRLCKLLRSKLFPHSPFSDTGNDTDANSPPTGSPGRLGSNIPRKGLKRSSSALSEIGDPGSRQRSRSLSVSLAQDVSTKRSNSSTSTTLKRALSREVSMSRVFKPRPSISVRGIADTQMTQNRSSDSGGHVVTKKQDACTQVITLVASTPTKPRTTNCSGNVRANGVCGSPIPINLDDLYHSDFEIEDDEMAFRDGSPDALFQRSRKQP